MSVSIAPERPDSPDALALVAELEAVLEPLYPAESQHGYTVGKLLQENVDFFVIRVDGRAAGCGGLKIYGKEYGEIKRMYIRPEFRGRGLAKRMLEHLENTARGNNVVLLRLETGIFQSEAIALYERMGYKSIPAFGEYKQDPLSLYFEKQINN